MDYFADLATNIETALEEDIGDGDLTASLIPDERRAIANVIIKEDAVVCGRPWFDACVDAVDSDIKIEWFCEEGQSLQNGDLVCRLSGQANSILTAERSALNFLQTLSATATVTQHYVNAMGDSQTKLLDTRKTLPGLRLAQKYAVKCGGGTNHRIGLYDAILIKENHIMAAGSIEKAVSQAKLLHPNKTVEVETESLDELQQAMDAQADIVMLDNFTVDQMQKAVEMVQKAIKLGQTAPKLEVSGNVEIDHLAELAKTGVDFISTGAITKHVRAIDYSMRFDLQD